MCKTNEMNWLSENFKLELQAGIQSKAIHY